LNLFETRQEAGVCPDAATKSLVQAFADVSISYRLVSESIS
jgi:hypothetical protein